MFATLRTLFRAAEAEAEEALIDANGMRLMAQHLRDAEKDTQSARRALATLIAQQKAELRRMDGLCSEIRQRELEVVEALDAEDTGLADDLADRIAVLEDRRAAAARARDDLEHRIGALRKNLSQADRRIGSLASELRSARATAICQKAGTALADGPCPSALERAEALSWRVRESSQQIEDQMSAMADLRTTERDEIDARVREAGLRDPDAKRRAKILDRIKSQSKQEGSSK